MSYKSKDRRTGNLFAELMPYGGKLDLNNRWIKLHDMIPWEDLEGIYRKYFSSQGRPGKDSQLINGLLVVKHQTYLSDDGVVEYFKENPYVQYLCGYEQFVTGKEIESSTLTRMRKRLGVEYFKRFEGEILKLLKERKVINDREQMVDATVFPSNVTYPTDTGLLEHVRGWLVGAIKKVRKAGGIEEKIRTHCRKARAVYLKFQKKRKRTVKEVRRVRKQLVQYVRRNIGQLKGLIKKAETIPPVMIRTIREKIKVAEKIYEQQVEMLREDVHRVEKRIVSFHRPQVRPIVRGKSGKDVEFGPKASVSFVDGYLFLDVFSHEAYNEGNVLKESIRRHQERFGKKPKVIITDKIYGSRENREMLREKRIRASLVPLGRKSALSRELEKWVKQKQKIRSRIEGYIGVSKVHYGLERLVYKNEELNVRLGLLAMNLSTALARI